MSWYVRTPERETGPLSDEALRAMEATQQLGADAQVWREGMAGWIPAADAVRLLDSAPAAEAVTGASDEIAHAPTGASPWRRFWARLFDVFVFSYIIAFVLGFLRPSLFQGFLGAHPLVFQFLLLPVVLIVEALVYAAFGNTPGKALAGVEVVADSGGRLALPTYLKRNLEIYLFGLGLGFPLISFVVLIANYMRARRGEISTWDTSVESQVITYSTGMARTWTVASGYLALVAASLVLQTIAQHRSIKEPARTPPVDTHVSKLSSVEAELQRLADDINRDGPRMVAPDTRFDAARAGPGDIFTYDYTMTKLRLSQTSPRELQRLESSVRDRLHAGACGQTHLASVLRIAGLLRAHYVDRDGLELVTVEVQRTDCR
jgi:uncharacterized RDD family membrane protein YckC